MKYIIVPSKSAESCNSYLAVKITPELQTGIHAVATLVQRYKFISVNLDIDILLLNPDDEDDRFDPNGASVIEMSHEEETAFCALSRNVAASKIEVFDHFAFLSASERYSTVTEESDEIDIKLFTMHGFND